MRVTTFLMPDYAQGLAPLTPDGLPPFTLPDGWYYQLGQDTPVGPFDNVADAGMAAFARVQLLREKPVQLKSFPPGRVVDIPLPFVPV